ncbi:unnamed protein product [Didymodactylos carnosus]|uniref:Uncharacterized protein n=1 Tax=Didymodactylos carnosus TaxID=1234261 RepID=A0A815GJ21_9BILA|nr:unnamed protein product [Didymodactylos carnosus]CAF4200928.1 unnamed protein product [Didymodactylos carnosus]
MAEETRSILLQHTVRHSAEVKLKLEKLTNELRQVRQSNGFIETDLREWEDKLKQLKEELVNPPNVVVREDSTMLVPKIRLDAAETTEVFERTFGNTKFEEGLKVVLRDDSTGHTDVRAKYEYATGQQTLRFKIEKLTQNVWIFFGIISKSTPLQKNSFRSPTSHSWSNRNQVAG